MKKIHLIITIVITLHLFACRTELPAQEMADAKQAINLAHEAQAERFAPELLKRASDNLYASHDAGRDNKTADALNFALASKQDAEMAAATSWPLLSIESLKTAQDMYAQAEILDAQKKAPAEMLSASEKITNATNENKAHNYRRSYLISQAAVQDIESAKDISLTALSSLSSEIDELRLMLSTFKEDPYIQPYTTDITYTEKLLDRAAENIINRNAREASLQIDEARDQVEKIQASLLTARQNAESAALAEAEARKRQQTETLETDKPVEKRTPVPVKKTENAKPRIYVVQYYETNKDCLWRIADKVYNDPFLWPRIYMANRDKIKNPDLIFPGQRLVIPAIDTAKTVDKKKAAQQKITPAKKGKNNAVSNKKAVKTDKSRVAPKDGGKKKAPEKRDNITNREQTDNKRDNTPANEGADTRGTSGRDSGGAATGTSDKGTSLPDGIFRENQ